MSEKTYEELGQDRVDLVGVAGHELDAGLLARQ